MSGEAWEEVDLASAPIPLGATRPAMVPRVGIPLSAALPLGVIAAEVQMIVTGIWGFVYAFLVFGAFALPLANLLSGRLRNLRLVQFPTMLGAVVFTPVTTSCWSGGMKAQSSSPVSLSKACR